METLGKFRLHHILTETVNTIQKAYFRYLRAFERYYANLAQQESTSDYDKGGSNDSSPS